MEKWDLLEVPTYTYMKLMSIMILHSPTYSVLVLLVLCVCVCVRVCAYAYMRVCDNVSRVTYFNYSTYAVPSVSEAPLTQPQPPQQTSGK